MASTIVRTQTTKGKVTAPLYVYYYHDRLRTTFPVGYSINPDHLNTERNRVTAKEPNWKEINEKIEHIEDRIESILKALPGHIEPTHTLIKEKFNGFVTDSTIASKQKPKVDPIQEIVEHIKLTREKGQELNLIHTLLKHYEEFLFDKQDVIAKSTMKAYTAFRKLYFYEWVSSPTYRVCCQLHNISIDPQFATKAYSKCFNQFMIKEKGYQDNQMGKTYKILKQFLFFLETSTNMKVNKEYRTYKFLKTSIEDFVVIPSNEMEMIWDYRREAKEREVKVVYLMMFSLWSGLRISEVLGNTFAVFKKNGKEYLTGVTYKNKSKIMLPLWKEPRIREVLDMWNPKGNRITYKMNLCSSVEFNRVSKQILKKIYEKNNIHQEPIPQHRTILGKQVVVATEYKHNLFTSRTCRRSAITLWRNVWKLTDIQIGYIIGTKKMEILNIYASRDREEIAKALEDI